MSHVVGTYERESAADAARHLFMDAGYMARRIVLLSPVQPGDDTPPLHLRRRGESMVRGAVRWGIIGALVTEVPLIIVLIFLPFDVNAKVLLASTVWKFGGAFGAWLGAMAASEHGLESEVASRYELLLNSGSWVLSADVPKKHRSFARGAMLESDATDVLDIQGTFELKPVQIPVRFPTGG